MRAAASSITLTRSGIGFLVGAVLSFAVAPLLSLPALVYVSGLLLALPLFSAIFVFVGHSRVRIERSFSPQVVPPGALSQATVRITNLSPLPSLEARWEDHLPRGVSGDAAGPLPALGGSRSSDARVSFSYSLHGQSRGRHEIGPLAVMVQDPFGLVHRRHTFGSAEPLTVLPRRIDLPPITPRGASEDGATRPAPHHVGVGDDDIIARAYLPGDALKRLHWKATAHRGELMVRQEEQQMTPRAAVFLDCEPSSQGTARDRAGDWEHSPLFEWGVTATASIAGHLVKAGYVVAVESSGTTVQRVVAEGEDSFEDAMVDLAVVQPEEVDHQRRSAPDGVTFAILGRLSVDRARHWTAALSTSRTVLAFVAHGTSSDVLDLLDAARWNVVRYRVGDDLAELWSRFDREHAGVES